MLDCFLSLFISFFNVYYQAAWWGHPITTGISDTIDYFISLDTEVTSAGDSHYSEQLVRMRGVNTVPLSKVRNF